MRFAFPLMLPLLILFNVQFCNAQQKANVSNTKVSIDNDFVLIRYDIVNYDQSSEFEVWIRISNSKGDSLHAATLQGDIGFHIKGGRNKEIIWHPAEDSIFLNEDIGIQVLANLKIKPGPQSETKPSENISEYNRTGIILQSLAFPGLGLSKMNGGPHWIRGIAGYACIAGSVVFNQKANQTYANYGGADTGTEASELLSKAESQTTISNVFAFSAIAIWITDLTWTLIGTSGMNKSKSTSDSGWSIGSEYDYLSQTPMVSIKYGF